MVGEKQPASPEIVYIEGASGILYPHVKTFDPVLNQDSLTLMSPQQIENAQELGLLNPPQANNNPA
jgi:hypothetical protein